MKYYGKEKCKILKEIRAEIARQNDIEWVVSACTHKGNCRGTCPKCEAEVRKLERELEKRLSLGKTIAVAGIAAGIALNVTGCMDMSPATDGSGSTANVPHTSDETVARTEGTDGVLTDVTMGEPVPENTEENTDDCTTCVPDTDGLLEESELMGEVPMPEDTGEDYPLMGEPMVEGD